MRVWYLFEVKIRQCAAKGIYIFKMATANLTYKDLLDLLLWAQLLSVIACKHVCLEIFKILQKQGKQHRRNKEMKRF